VPHDVRVARRGRRGEGTTYYSKADRRWVARFPLGIIDGKRASKRVKCRTEKQALSELERLRRAYGAGGVPAMQTLDVYLDEWLAGHGPSVRTSTATSYRGHIDLHISPLLGGIPVASLRPSDVRRLIAHLGRKGLKPATVGRVVTTLRIALNAAVAERSLSHNPASGVRLPRVEREPIRALTHEEADQIRDAVAGHWIEYLVRLLLGSAMRLGEACGLDQGDVFLDEAFVRVRRTKTDARSVPIGPDAVEALRTALAKAPRRGVNEPLFLPPRRGDRLRGSSVSHALTPLLANAGLGHLTPHALRHGAASIMLADGHPMRVIAEQLGHKNPAITARIYAHVLPAAQRAAVASLDRRRKA
jgi:integrase